jgi:lysozyme family protein
MSRAETCIPRILKHEGGFVHHKSDPGGATNKGITIATYRRYIDRDGTVADLKALTTEQAVKVYKHQYWNAVKANSLPVGVDYAVADFAVNSGPGRATRYLQRVVGVAQDGVIGPKTLEAVNKLPPELVVEELCDARMAFLKRLKTWPTFGKGWTRRVNEVRTASLVDIEREKQPIDEPIHHDDPAEQGGILSALVALFLKLFGART